MKLKPRIIAGMIVTLLGVLALIFPEISYKTDEETMQVGPFSAKMETRKQIPIHPAIAGALIVGGLAVAFLRFTGEKS
ncbi:MAG TPA: hypothetical protein VGA40_06240 [Candidatus Acidoferrales bacterium]